MENTQIVEDDVLVRILSVKPEEYIEPKESKGKYEESGFLMNDFEKKVYTVFQEFVNEFADLFEKLSSENHSDEEMAKLQFEVNVARDKAESTRNFMYFIIPNRLNLWGHDLGVSKGWKITFIDVEAEVQERATSMEIFIGPDAFFKLMGCDDEDESGEAEKSEVFSEMARNISRDVQGL